MAEEEKEKTLRWIDTATARDVLARMFPEHAMPEQEARAEFVCSTTKPFFKHPNALDPISVTAPPLVVEHGVANVDLVNEHGAVITCSCGELLPFGPENAAPAGLPFTATEAIKRLGFLGKVDLAKVGASTREAAQ